MEYENREKVRERERYMCNITLLWSGLLPVSALSLLVSPDKLQ